LIQNLVIVIIMMGFAIGARQGSCRLIYAANG
jgi:hypothetical protein